MRRATNILLASCFAGWMQPVIAASVDERDMKAALIYNFSMYTTWPENSDQFFNICMFDGDQENLNEALLERRVLNGKPIHVRNIRDMEDLKTCQVLFMEEATTKNDKQLLQQLKKNSVLFVHNGEKQTDASMIHIELVDKRYHFSINQQVAKDANLTLSSKLLRLATRVY
jgi:YfiR/HmsC-like